MFHSGISDPGAMLELRKSSAISETLSLKDSRRRHPSSLGAEGGVKLTTELRTDTDGES